MRILSILPTGAALGLLTLLLALSPSALSAFQDGDAMRVGVMLERPPIAFTYPGDPDHLRGIAVELATMLNSAMDMKTEFTVAKADDLHAMLWAGEIDYICGLPSELVLDDSRSQVLTTSFATNRRIVATNPDVYISSELDYKGQRLAVIDDTYKYIPVIESYGGIPMQVSSYQDGFSLLTSGQADAFIVPSGEIASYLALMEGVDGLRFMGLSLERFPNLIVLREGDDLLKTRLSGHLVRLEEMGVLDGLREKWFGRPLIREPSFWEKHQAKILAGLTASLLALLLVATWTFTLRRRVRAVTSRLLHSEQRYRDLLEASPDAILSMDAGGRVHFANNSARLNLLSAGMNGMPGDWPDGSVFRGLDTDAMAVVKGLLEKAFAGLAARGSVELVHKGEARTFELIVFPTPDGQNGQTLACCIARDMSERHRMEKELIKSERLAVIGKLAAGVAHEINNPLGIVQTNAEVVLKLSDDPAITERLQAVRRNIGRATDITRRLLRLAAPQSLNLIRLDLAAQVRESLSFLQPRLRQVHVDLSELPSGLTIQGDQTLIQQLLINLLLNALDSMEDRGRLSLAGNLEGGEGGLFVVLRITDSGKGIASGDLEKIFDLFYTTRNSEGFGLGLFLSRSIVEQHGGQIAAESGLGGGATMVIRFPA